MGVPVVTKFQDQNDGTFRISMMFYVSEDSPPAPTTPGVSLEQLYSFLYVKSFPSFVVSPEFLFTASVQDLRKTLGDNSLSYSPGVSYHVRYDTPWTVFRYNEVWLQ